MPGGKAPSWKPGWTHAGHSSQPKPVVRPVLDPPPAKGLTRSRWGPGPLWFLSLGLPRPSHQSCRDLGVLQPLYPRPSAPEVTEASPPQQFCGPRMPLPTPVPPPKAGTTGFLTILQALLRGA